MLQLRPYQEQVIEECFDLWAQDVANVCLVMPTGAGKTHTKSAITKMRDQPTMAVAHRQELVVQISESLAAYGIHHKIIAPTPVLKFCAARHVQLFGNFFTQPKAKVMVASVQTLLRRQEQFAREFRQIQFWDIDECFPAGTLVDGRPIENIKVGDLVTAFNEETGEFEKRPVTALMQNPMPEYMVRLTWGGHHVLTCTPGHPIWTKRGWVEAGDLKSDDEVLYVRQRRGPQSEVDAPVSGQRQSVLQQDLQWGVSGKNLVEGDGRDEPASRLETDERAQSDAVRSCSRESVQDTVGNETSTQAAGRQRQTGNGSRDETVQSVRAVGVQPASDRSDRWARSRIPDTLQDRLRTSEAEDRDRSGREQSLNAEETGAGRAEDGVAQWTRLESVSFLKRDDLGETGTGLVYNLEVSGLHTYVAEGVTVHNCHHVLPENQWGKAVNLFPNAQGLGVTATPLRCDRRGLDGTFERLVVGPSMRELIDQGFLADYRIFCPPASLNRANIRVSRNGDFQQASMIEENRRSTITGDVVEHYLRLAAGKTGLTFTVDVETAQIVADRFNQAGVPAKMLHAGSGDQERTETLDALKRGDIKMITNVDLFGEGFDCPALEVVHMARPTQSYGLYVQQFGRALRPLEGKTHGLLIDHVGNVMSHGLPDRPRPWSLAGRDAQERDPDDVPIRVCEACLQPFEGFLILCPHCGHKPEPQSRASLEHVDGDLEELDPAVLRRMRGEVIPLNGGEPAIPYNAPQAVVGRKMREWRELQDAQRQMREVIAVVAGAWKHGQGLDDREINKRFYQVFGMSIPEACALRRAQAERFTATLRDYIT